MSNSPSEAPRYVVVSSDCHAGPSSMREYRGYTESRYRDEYEEYLDAVEAYDARNLGANPLFKDAEGPLLDKTRMPDFDPEADMGRVQGLRFGYPGLWDPNQRKRDLDADGIACEVIYPQGSVPFAAYPAIGAASEGVVLFKLGRDDLQVAGTRMYNRWLADLCSTEPVRHVGVAVVPMRDIDAAVNEVRWARENGLGAVSIPPLTLNGDQYLPTYNQPLYEPFWSACEDLEMPICSHGGGGQPFFGGGPETAALMFIEADWPVGRRALWQMIFGGVFERHPGLKLVITEQRIGWVPDLLSELDNIYEAPKANVRHILPLRPSEYFARNCYVGASFMSSLECERRYEIGLDRIMWGSDYPHSEGAWPWTHEAYRRTFAAVPANERRLLLGQNGIRCYNLDEKALVEIAARIGPTEEEMDQALTEAPPGSWIPWAFRAKGAWA
jgi:predicted TIM-barrel fold metal-dependent hydrolase